MVIGIDLEGHKDYLGMWVGEHESAKFWLGILNDLKSRGVKDILINCVDNLYGFSEAIASGLFPNRCPEVHRLSNPQLDETRVLQGFEGGNSCPQTDIQSGQ
jgi:hypothetical protein